MRLRRRHQKITLIRVMHLGDAPRISAGANGRYGEARLLLKPRVGKGQPIRHAGTRPALRVPSKCPGAGTIFRLITTLKSPRSRRPKPEI
jgi:hypothetical protein